MIVEKFMYIASLDCNVHSISSQEKVRWSVFQKCRSRNSSFSEVAVVERIVGNVEIVASLLRDEVILNPLQFCLAWGQTTKVIWDLGHLVKKPDGGTCLIFVAYSQHFGFPLKSVNSMVLMASMLDHAFNLNAFNLNFN